MSFLKRLFASKARQSEASGEPAIHIADPRFDDWEVVREFQDLETARTWQAHLRLARFDAELTSDWPLDRYRRGDIYLCVPKDQWWNAEEFVSAFE